MLFAKLDMQCSILLFESSSMPFHMPFLKNSSLYTAQYAVSKHAVLNIAGGECNSITPSLNHEMMDKERNKERNTHGCVCLL